MIDVAMKQEINDRTIDGVRLDQKTGKKKKYDDIVSINQEQDKECCN